MSDALRQIATAHRAPGRFRVNTTNARRTKHARIADPGFANADRLIFRDVAKRDGVATAAVNDMNAHGTKPARIGDLRFANGRT
jgi:hypothetical protein